MVKLIQINNMNRDGTLTINTDNMDDEINGKILKVYIKSNHVLDKVRVRLVNLEDEDIINHALNNQTLLMYPYNRIENVTPEFPRVDYFYVVGPLRLIISGLVSGDMIESIRIFLE